MTLMKLRPQVGLHMRNFIQMANYLTKLEQMATAQTDPMYVYVALNARVLLNAH